MKTVSLIGFSISIFFVSCSDLNKNDDIAEFIPGTFIRYSRHEFGSEFDTVIITLQNKFFNQYKILRKWKYERILDGVKLEPDYKIHTTSATYDQNSMVLKEQETDNTYSFDPKQNLLFTGSTKYQKLK